MARGATATLDKLVKRAEKISLSDLIAAEHAKKPTPPEITELVAAVLAAGLRTGASAIHIEPRSDGAYIRHRIDGVLTDTSTLPKTIAPLLIAGLKILAHIPIDEDESLPQQATTSVTVQQKPYRLQIATVPVEGGEKAVVQLSGIGEKAPTLKELGYWGPNLKTISDAITKQKGLILLAGPHDAGQAEGAFGILSHLDSPGVSVATVEDPILYHIPGATQVQVNERVGLHFAGALRILLKQDANILMVSNLRDTETAQLAVEGALGGRLIVAGIHGSSASSAIGYLLAAGIEPYLVAHTLQAIVGQRSVRRLCDDCKELYSPGEQEVISLLRSLDIKTATQLQRVRDLLGIAIEEKLIVGSSPTDKGAFMAQLYRPSKAGCATCSHTGYKGSIGIYEVLPGDGQSLQRLILSNAAPNIIEDQAMADGMPTMQMDGLVKALLGLTSVDEVVNATQ